ncbi:SRPBCC family protein [Psychroserpens burtonensis]|uniref:SRPBCC family protein n=1 Tax=Psychroserpens burtonensis TaxID=49278 RepID=A0A5C7B739_9FLAO|nr:SRPBCC family protein [Psychroserpens burtonensis]TXE16883.1 SRPBCC family protein [Psychroserpens burtonensis]
MKYTTEIKVNVTLDEFIKKMDNVDNMKHWQHGFVSAEHISGDLGQLGAKMKLKYRFGKRKMEIIETITKRNLPNEFHANYTMKAMQNVQQNYFKNTNNGFTKWTSITEFVPLNLKMRLMLFFIPRAFKKQSLIYMRNFKSFAENGTSIANA